MFNTEVLCCKSMEAYAYANVRSSKCIIIIISSICAAPSHKVAITLLCSDLKMAELSR